MSTTRTLFIDIMTLIPTHIKVRNISYEFIITSTLQIRLFLLFLSSQHPIIRDDLEVQSITYHTKEAKISGKRKRGAAKVNPDTQVMSIKTTNKNFNIPACITAQLLETNEKLIRNPGLVKDSDGFIGIFMVSLDKVKKVLSTLK